MLGRMLCESAISTPKIKAEQDSQAWMSTARERRASPIQDNFPRARPFQQGTGIISGPGSTYQHLLPASPTSIFHSTHPHSEHSGKQGEEAAGIGGTLGYRARRDFKTSSVTFGYNQPQNPGNSPWQLVSLAVTATLRTAEGIWPLCPLWTDKMWKSHVLKFLGFFSPKSLVFALNITRLQQPVFSVTWDWPV